MAIATPPRGIGEGTPVLEEAPSLDDLLHALPQEDAGGTNRPTPPTADGAGDHPLSWLAVTGIATGITALFLLALGLFAAYPWISGRATALSERAAAAVAAPPTSQASTASTVSAAPAAPLGGQPAASAAVEVTASEFKFAPAELKLAGPGQLKITLKNAGAVEHDVVVEGVDGKLPAAAGQTAVGSFTFAKEGVYTFFCSIPGHRDAGMVGKITVGNAAAAPVGAAGTTVAPTAGMPMAGMPMAGMPMAPAAVPTAQAEPRPEGTRPADPNARPLPAPRIAPPVDRTQPALVKVDLETKEVTARLADGQDYTFWTFGGTVPGPMIRVRQGDTVELTLRNDPGSKVTHSIDLHAVTGPGGGAKVTQVPAGGQAAFRFQALNPGVYVYHCATPMVAQHISNGMYGLIVVEPPEGLAKVDREFYVMQGDIYVKGARGQAGHREASIDKLLDERPDYVVFNGGVGQLAGDRALKAKVGETVRIFFGVGGPNLPSSFHVIGEVFDRVYPEAGTAVNTNVQTTFVPAGGAAVVEFKAEVPGTYTLVDHSLGRLEKGAAGQLVVEGPENPAVFQPLQVGAGGGGGH